MSTGPGGISDTMCPMSKKSSHKQTSTSTPPGVKDRSSDTQETASRHHPFVKQLQQVVKKRKEISRLLYDNSLAIILRSQISSGGTTASFQGSRYAGDIYSIGHAITTRAFIAAGKQHEAKEALIYAFTTDCSEEGLMYGQYDLEGKSVAPQPAQVAANAETLIAVGAYLDTFDDTELLGRYRERIMHLERGLAYKCHSFKEGMLVGSDFGYELEINAAAVAAYRALATIYDVAFQEKYQSGVYSRTAEDITQGIEAYLFVTAFGSYMRALQTEPELAVDTAADLRSLLSLFTYHVFDPQTTRMQQSLTYHLSSALASGSDGDSLAIKHADAVRDWRRRPGPEERLVLAAWYTKCGAYAQARGHLDWVLNVARLNTAHELGLPEHLVWSEEVDAELAVITQLQELGDASEHREEYERELKSTMAHEYGVIYTVNPFVWNHAYMVLCYDQLVEYIEDLV